MRLIKCLVLIFCMFISLGANALKSTDITKEQYLINHGHSDDMVRMVEIQKSRLEPEKPEHKKFETKSRFVKFFKNIFYEKDLTMPLEDFGQDRIRTVESPKR